VDVLPLKQAAQTALALGADQDKKLTMLRHEA
jgi:hypothetical protein